MFVNPSVLDTTDLYKLVRPFLYNSASVDLLDGDLVMVDWSVGTYGLGRTVAKSSAGGPFAYIVGAVDYAVDASADFVHDPYQRIDVVVKGTKTNTNAIALGGCTAAGVLQMQSAATAGQHIDVTVGSEHCAFGISKGAGAAGGKCVNGVFFFGLYAEV